MGEGADDLKKDLSPARLYLDMLGKQLEQIESRQTEADRRHQELQAGQADLVTQMLQKIGQVTEMVESKDSTATLSELHQAVEHLGRTQVEVEGQLQY